MDSEFAELTITSTLNKIRMHYVHVLLYNFFDSSMHKLATHTHLYNIYTLCYFFKKFIIYFNVNIM